MEFKALFGNFTQPGIVTYISVRPERVKPVKAVQSVMALEGKGLEGDRYKNKDGSRQVTMIQQEHLKAVASFLGKNVVDPSLTRRNIVVEGINLLALKDKVFHIGEAVFEYSGECHPCSRMEQNLGMGGYNAMRGHGGITAKIIRSGLISVHDKIWVDEQ